MKIVTAVIGILINDRNDVLIALRPPHVTYPGVWEFPGGKIEQDETPETALIRELKEEIGIDVKTCEFFLKTIHDTAKKQTTLHAYKILKFHGSPYGAETQEIRWVPINTLKNYEFPKANASVIRALELAVYF
ncbi:MAG TPA: 8-oxo-dGTP diphosphatase MutT [Coxiellaceae bacterium]|nr:8-oxo-dGTP diphosphatase MutT [Coxiellaceae bacterium]